MAGGATEEGAPKSAAQCSFRRQYSCFGMYCNCLKLSMHDEAMAGCARLHCARARMCLRVRVGVRVRDVLYRIRAVNRRHINVLG